MSIKTLKPAKWIKKNICHFPLLFLKFGYKKSWRHVKLWEWRMCADCQLFTSSLSHIYLKRKKGSWFYQNWLPLQAFVFSLIIFGISESQEHRIDLGRDWELNANICSCQYSYFATALDLERIEFLLLLLSWLFLKFLSP